jgi:hypothetical protein
MSLFHSILGAASFDPIRTLGFPLYVDMADSSTYRNTGEFLMNKANLPSGNPATELITNGTFDTNTSGWSLIASGSMTWDSTNQRVTITNTIASNAGIKQSFTTVVGRKYRVYVNSYLGTGGTSCSVWIGNSSGNSSLGSITRSAATNEHIHVFTATATTTFISLVNGNATSGTIVYFDNISVKEVDTNCYQSTPSKRGTISSGAVLGKDALSLNSANSAYYLLPSIMTGSTFTKFVTFKIEGAVSAAINTYWQILGGNTGHAMSVFKVSSSALRFNDAILNISYDTHIDNNSMVFTWIYSCTNGTQNWFINGKKVATFTKAVANSDSNLYLGVFNSTQGPFNGYICDFGVHPSVALSDTQCAQLDEHQRLKYRLIPSLSDYALIAGVGQSNCAGNSSTRGADSSSAGYNYLNSVQGYRVLNDTTGESPYAANIGSFWPALANRLNSNHSLKSIIVNTAVTGTAISSIAATGGASTHWGSTGTLRSDSLTMIQNAKSKQGYNGRTVVVINVGERDVSYMNANTGTYNGTMYQAGYQDLVDYYKTNIPGCLIVIIKTGPQFSAGVEVYQTQRLAINQAQQNVADGDTTNIIVVNRPTTYTSANMEADGIHYNQTTNTALGSIIADAIGSIL